MDFRNAYAHGFARVAACTLPVVMADPARNAQATIEQARALHDDGVAVALFPELGLSGYAIDDLLLQDVLLDAVEEAVVTIAEATAKEEGKPEAALPRIIEGRVNGFFKENVLLEQPFAKDAKKSVGKVLEEAGTKATAFARFRVGQ